MVASRSGILGFIHLPASIFLNKLGPNVAANIPKNVSLTCFINKPVSSRDLTVLANGLSTFFINGKQLPLMD